MCGRVHSSARRWHVAWMADAFLCRARTLCSRQTLEGFEKWLLRSGSLASHRSFRNCRTKRETAPIAGLRSRAAVQRVIRTYYLTSEPFEGSRRCVLTSGMNSRERPRRVNEIRETFLSTQVYRDCDERQGIRQPSSKTRLPVGGMLSCLWAAEPSSCVHR